MNHQKNYIGFLNDYSGSMYNIKAAAVKDYNANVTAVKDAATKNMQDTIVSMFGFGGVVTKEVVNSNPHVLKPLTDWKANGGTPLNQALLEMIALFQSMPDYTNPNVSFVVLVTTDGDDTDTHNRDRVAAVISTLSRDERWTFVFRVPRGGRHNLNYLPVPAGNIQEWDTTEAGLAASTAATTQAFDSFYAARAAGKKGSNVFYTNTSAVNTSALTDISARTSLYIVDQFHNGAQIRDFILSKRTEYLIGAAFYQLTKTEPRVSPSKLILIREKTTGKVYAGPDARVMLGLDTLNNARIHPNHGNGAYDIFIQSESVNRKLVAGTGVLYWAEKGRPVTQADLERYAGQNNAPAVPVLAQAPATGRPTQNPVSVATQKKVASLAQAKPQAILPKDGGRVRFHAAPVSAVFYATRDMARAQALVQGKKSYDAGPTAPKGQRFYVA